MYHLPPSTACNLTSGPRPRCRCPLRAPLPLPVLPRRYEVRTFSRPVHPLALVAFPLTRFYQAKFGRDSALAVVRRIQDPGN